MDRALTPGLMGAIPRFNYLFGYRSANPGKSSGVVLVDLEDSCEIRRGIFTVISVMLGRCLVLSE